MFRKFGSIISAEPTTAMEWRKLILASTVHGVEPMTALAEFDLDKDNFVYVRARAVSAGEYHGPNANHDFFGEGELKKSFRTFIRRGVYVNHKSDDPAGAIGIILDAIWHDDDRKYVECLMAIDRAEPIAQKIEAGIANSWSIGCIVKKCECSVCGSIARSESEYCDHLANHLGREYNGKKVYSINKDLSFYELSNVTIPADSNAYTLQVFASKEEKNLAKKFMDLADEYARKVKASETAGIVRVKLEEPKPAVLSERKVAQSVRRRLKVATAKLLPREGLTQRVKAALDEAPPLAEKKKIAIAENPLDGVIVENNLTIRYIPGVKLAECLFVARKGKLQATVAADKLLDPKVAAVIEAKEMKKSAAPGAEKLKDDTKPKADHELKVGDEDAQPSKEVNKLSAEPAKEVKDDMKPKADSEMKVGDEPAQPSDVVKRLAQALGAKNVTFKTAKSGGFTAYLSGGSIARLATLWGTVPRLVREAKVAGEPMDWAREITPAPKGKLTDRVEISREKKGWDQLEKPKGGHSGAELKKYFQGYDTRDQATGGQDGWAKKFNELTKVAASKDAEIKALKIENDTLKKTVEAVKKSAVEEKKMRVIASIVGYMEKAGAIKPDMNEVLDRQEKGASHEDAQVGAYKLAFDKKKAELRQLDLKALETMAQNLADFVPSIEVKAGKKDLEIPITGRDAEFADEATRLAQNWD